MPWPTSSRIRLGTTPSPTGPQDHKVERRLAANFAASLAADSPSDLGVLPPNCTLARYALDAALTLALRNRFWARPEHGLHIESYARPSRFPLPQI